MKSTCNCLQWGVSPWSDNVSDFSGESTGHLDVGSFSSQLTGEQSESDIESFSFQAESGAGADPNQGTDTLFQIYFPDEREGKRKSE